MLTTIDQFAGQDIWVYAELEYEDAYIRIEKVFDDGTVIYNAWLPSDSHAKYDIDEILYGELTGDVDSIEIHPLDTITTDELIARFMSDGKVTASKKFTKYPQGYVKASITSSSWFRTDDYQICKDLGGGVYDFIEFIGADGQMFSSSGTVNVNDYKDSDGNWNADALSIIRTYYSDLDELRRSVSNPADEDQIVAECIFEQTSSYDSDSLTMSEDEAYAYLDDVISGKVMASTGSSTKGGRKFTALYNGEIFEVSSDCDDLIKQLKAEIDEAIANGDVEDIDFGECWVEDEDEEVMYIADGDSDYAKYL